MPDVLGVLSGVLLTRVLPCMTCSTVLHFINTCKLQALWEIIIASSEHSLHRLLKIILQVGPIYPLAEKKIDG